MREKLSIESVRAMVCLAAICWIGGFYFGRAIARQAHKKGIAAGLGVSNGIPKELRQYKDVAGNPCSLDWLVKNEPEWAANQIRHRDKLEIAKHAKEELHPAIAALEQLYTSCGHLRLRCEMQAPKLKAFSDWDENTKAMRTAENVLRLSNE